MNRSDINGFLRRYQREVRWAIGSTSSGKHLGCSAEVWDRCDWCQTLYAEVGLELEKRLARMDRPHCPAAWIRAFTPACVVSAIRSLRVVDNVGARPERPPKWLAVALDHDPVAIEAFTQLRWWCGPQPVTVEETPVPYGYLAGRLDMTDTDDFRAMVDWALRAVEDANPDWFYDNVGRKLEERSIIHGLDPILGDSWEPLPV